MSRLDGDEELFDNMLAVVSSLETALPDWRVRLLLLDFRFPPDAEAVMMRWGKKPVSISPHGHLPWLFLPQI
jgi:hypothetical protein